MDHCLYRQAAAGLYAQIRKHFRCVLQVMRRSLPLMLIVAALAAAGLFAAWSASGSSSLTVTARLSAGAERPAPKAVAAATGIFTGTLTGSSLRWRLTFSRLTGKAVAAHIHLGKRGVACHDRSVSGAGRPSAAVASACSVAGHLALELLDQLVD